MNTSIKKAVIIAVFFLYLSGEASAAVIGRPVETEEIKDVEAIDKVDEGLEGEGSEVDDVKVFEGPATYKCGNLSCPNGAFCEIKQKPDFAEKKVTITTQCRDADGTVLVEEATTDDIPDGSIPFTSVARKIVNGNNVGAYYGSSYAGSFKSGDIGVDDSTDPNDAEQIRAFSTYYREIMSRQTQILRAASNLLKEVSDSSKWFL